MLQFLRRHQAAEYFIQSQPVPHFPTGGGRIPRQHDQPVYAQIPQFPDGQGRSGLHLVGHAQTPQQHSVQGHVNRGTAFLQVIDRHTGILQKCLLARQNGPALHPGGNASARHFHHIRHTLRKQGASIRFHNGTAQRMGSGAFRVGRPVQQAFRGYPGARQNFIHGKHAFRQRPRLVKHHGLYLAQRIQIAAALHQDSVARRPAYPGKETQGDGQH